MKNKIALYDRIASQYVLSQKRFYRGRQDEATRTIFSLAKNLKGKKLLDVGCGNGDQLALACKKGAEVYGIDISPKMIGEAKRSHSFLNNLSVQDLNKLRFNNNSFDIVISRFALQHLDNVEKGLGEIWRVLKPGGTAVFLVGHPFMQFLIKKHKTSYFTKNIVSVPLYGNKVTVSEPAHTMSEYLTPWLFSHFKIVHFEEGPRHAKSEVKSLDRFPLYFVLELRKNRA
jgi:ubiquinone/menaquinone biosynthesis C-methylase UbiE